MNEATREGKGRTGLENYCSLKTQTQKLSDYSQIHCLKNNPGFISLCCVLEHHVVMNTRDQQELGTVLPKHQQGHVAESTEIPPHMTRDNSPDRTAALGATLSRASQLLATMCQGKELEHPEEAGRVIEK